MSLPSRGFATLVAIPITGLMIVLVGNQAVPTPLSAPSAPEPAIQGNPVAHVAVDPSRSAPRPAERAERLVAIEVEPEIDVEGASEPRADIVDVRKLDWLRTERSRLEALIAKSEDLQDRRIWDQVKQLVGPAYSCTLERQGRGVPIERASATQADGSHGVSNDGHDLVYLGFGMAYHMDYAEFPCMQELLDTAGELTGFASDTGLALDADALASRLARFCARIDAEL